jgi:hypothetical protein
MTERTPRIVNRRRFLAAVSGTTVALAGCSGNSSSGTDGGAEETQGDALFTDTTTASPTEGPADPDGSRNTGPIDGIERAYAIPRATPIGIDGDRVVAQTLADGGPALAAYNYLTGEQLWERNPDEYDTPAINAGGQVGYGRLYSLASESYENNYINVIDVGTGELLGTQEFDDDNTRLVPLDGGAFFVMGAGISYTAFYVNGDTAEREEAFSPSDVWRLGQERPAGDPTRAHRLTGGGMYAGGRRLDGSEFRYGDTEPRQEIEVLGPTNCCTRPARASSRTAVFGSRSNNYADDLPVQARSREDGSVLWERSDINYIPPYGYGGGTLTYLGGERVIGVEPSNGDVRWERTDLDLSIGANYEFAVTDRALIVGTGNGINLLGLNDGTTVASSTDESFNPLVATQSRVLTTGTVNTGSGEVDGMVVYEY